MNKAENRTELKHQYQETPSFFDDLWGPLVTQVASGVAVEAMIATLLQNDNPLNHPSNLRGEVTHRPLNNEDLESIIGIEGVLATFFSRYKAPEINTLETNSGTATSLASQGFWKGEPGVALLFDGGRQIIIEQGQGKDGTLYKRELTVFPSTKEPTLIAAHESYTVGPSQNGISTTPLQHGYWYDPSGRVTVDTTFYDNAIIKELQGRVYDATIANTIRRLNAPYRKAT